MLRVGLVGTGDAGKHHARALTTVAGEGRLTWSAVCARDAKRLARFREELAVPESVATFGTLEALIDARACDAVILATPDGVHPEQVERAARAGLHVLVEKPLALTRSGGERAVAAARVSDVHLAVGYHLRHHAAHRTLLARTNELVGNVRTIFVRWAWPDPATDGWRAKGDGARFWSLAALGTHAIDLAMWLAREDHASDVAALLDPPSGIDRGAEVTMRLGSILAHVSVSVAHRAVSRVIVSGDAGELEATGTLGARGDGELWHRAPRQAPVAIAFEAENPYAAQVRDFLGRARAPGTFSDDASLLSNLDVLDRITTLTTQGAS
ncbi:MAG: Oxidoreductase domain protein [Labilithrix sp.]|nr:Oxidoreductase domain protein [Labilithrix sp.]